MSETRRLAAKWRAIAALNSTKGEHASYVAKAFAVCANELEAALQAEPTREQIRRDALEEAATRAEWMCGKSHLQIAAAIRALAKEGK